MAEYIKKGNCYLVDVTHGKLLTIEELMERKQAIIDKKPLTDMIFMQTVDESFIGEIDENGYIIGWDPDKYREYARKWIHQKVHNVVIDDTGIHEEAPSSKPHEEERETTANDEKFDFDIPFWVNNSSTFRTTQGGMNMGNTYRGMHEASHAADYTQERANTTFESARKQSATPKKHAAARNRGNVEEVKKGKSELAIKIISYILVAALTATGSIHVKNAIDEHITNKNVEQAQVQIASLLVPEGASNVPSIVARSTHPTEDFQGFWYDNANIANEVLQIPDQLFDAALYSVYEQMGEYRYSTYVRNFDSVITNIGEKATAALNPTAFARCNGCTSFEEYLAKNGIASEADYVKFMREKINEQAELIAKSALAHDFAQIDPVTQEEIDAENKAKEAEKNGGEAVLSEEAEEDLNVGGSRK